MSSTHFDVALVQILLVGAVGWLFYYTALASGQKSLADMVKVTTFFICVSIGAGAVWELLNVMADKIQAVMDRLESIARMFSFFRG